jgi:hypothetical protein
LKSGNEFVIMRTGVLLSRHVDEASPGRRWCPVSQSPADGPERVPRWDAFSGDDALAPGPKLTELLGEAVAALGELDERQLLGAGSAARRLRAYADYLEVMEVAEFGRRRAEQLEASKARGDRVRSRDGEYPAEELGFEMNASAYSGSLSNFLCKSGQLSSFCYITVDAFRCRVRQGRGRGT